MGDELKCEYCEKSGFKTPQALAGHIRMKHPEKVDAGEPSGKGAPRVEAREVPIVEEDFATLLRKFKIKGDLATNIAENISHTGGSNVFENPELLFKRLTAWSSDVNPSRRKLIIEQWFAERGVDISPEVQLKAGMTTEQLRKAEGETKTAGEMRYIYEPESRQIRMAKKDERGGTLAQAKELKKMADEDEKAGTESPFMQDADGKWVLNPKARVTGMELMAVQFLQQAQAKGEPADPIAAMARAAETWKTLREGLGGGGGTQPAWMTDPVAFVEAIKTITGQEGLGGGGGTQPAWMTDPTEFIKTVKAITGDTGGDSVLKEALTEMRQSLDAMKEERYRDQFAGQQKQIQDLSTVLKQTLGTISDLQKGRVGRTEMDIIHEIVTGGKEELSGLRKDVKEAFTSSSLPPAKSAEEREGRKRRVKGALKIDQEIEDLGKRLFFPQG